MNMFTKVLSIGALLTVAACVPTSAPPKADSYVLLFVVHTTKAEAPPPGIGLPTRPSLFLTLDECNKAKDALVKSFADEDAAKWFVDNQVDKKAVTCLPVSF